MSLNRLYDEKDDAYVRERKNRHRVNNAEKGYAVQNENSTWTGCTLDPKGNDKRHELKVYAILQSIG